MNPLSRLEVAHLSSDDQIRLMIAVHEAGHAVVGQRNGERPRFVQTNGAGRSGFTRVAGWSDEMETPSRLVGLQTTYRAGQMAAVRWAQEVNAELWLRQGADGSGRSDMEALEALMLRPGALRLGAVDCRVDGDLDATWEQIAELASELFEADPSWLFGDRRVRV